MRAFFDPRQFEHRPLRELHNGDWTAHVETPARAQRILDALGEVEAAKDFGREPIARVHDAGYLAFLESAFARWREAGRPGDAIGYIYPVVRRRELDLSRIDALVGRYSMDGGTPIAEGTWTAALASAQTALTALDAVTSAGARHSFALCRPCGHHAGADYLGGYCYLNNAAIVAEAARAQGAARVAVIDVDYHHANGTQDIFYARGDVFTLSLHADPRTDYPFYWGHPDEPGEGAGAGANLNLPLPQGTEIDAYLDALARGLEAVSAFDPELVVVSYGADTYIDDPISGFRIRTHDYPLIARAISALGRPTVIVMEGGYDVDSIGRNVVAFLQGF